MNNFPAKRLLILLLPLGLVGCGVLDKLTVAIDQASDPLVRGDPNSRSHVADTMEECRAKAREDSKENPTGSFQVVCFPGNAKKSLMFINVDKGGLRSPSF